jgi:ribosomal protein S3
VLLENLLKNIKKLLPVSRQVTINVLEVQNADLDANLLADLAEQLEKRIVLEELFEALQRAQKTECKWNKNPSFRTFEWS